RREAIAAGAEEAGRQVLPAILERRVGVADGAVVADVGRDDGLGRNRRLDRTPCLPRAHEVGVPRARFLVPDGAGIVLLVVERREFLCPAGLRRGDKVTPCLTAFVAGAAGKTREDA